MRIIDRYLLREILPYMLLGTVLLTAVIFIHEASRFADLFIVFARAGVNDNPLIKLLASLLPSILVFTLPISLLLGILLGLSRMSGDSEIIALRAGGIGRSRILMSVLMLSFIVAVITGYLTFRLLPGAIAAFDDLKLTRTEVLVRGIAGQIKPRVFIENFPGKVVYIQDIDKEKNQWKHIFVATDNTKDEAQVVTAEGGQFQLGESLQESALLLNNGWSQKMGVKDGKITDQLASFGSLEVKLVNQDDQPKAPDPKPAEIVPSKLGMRQLYESIPPRGNPDRRAFLVELNKRFALPIACLVFGVIGVGLGISVPRGGRSLGLVLGIVLMLGYYLLFAAGENASTSGTAPAWLGVWLPNILFLIVGLALIYKQRSAGGIFGSLGRLSPNFGWLKKKRIQRRRKQAATSAEVEKKLKTNGETVGYHGRLLRLLDVLILKDLTRFFSMMVITLTAIFIIFTLFALLNSIIKNHVSPTVVVAYFLFLSPQILVYMTPLAILVAILATFGILSKSSQVIAMLASGNSVYRLSAPILLVGITLSISLFALQEWVVPFANRQQDSLRFQIKAGQEPPQTFYKVNSRWVLGEGPLPRIYHFQHFDPLKDTFANLAVFEMDSANFALNRRIFASQAQWDAGKREWILTNGWIRTMDDGKLKAENFDSYHLKTGDGPLQFKQETPEPSKMTTAELLEHIRELGRNGFDVLDLRIALYSKFASPFTCLVMALVSLPFAFSVGKHGALYGVGLSIFIGVIYWGMLGLFTSLGHYEMLPPLLAAWGPNLLFGAGGSYLLLSAKT